MKLVHFAALALAGSATAAFAGPPYLTDDPIPTDTGHWEIYAFGRARAANQPSTPTLASTSTTDP